jgi:hypothetical protein
VWEILFPRLFTSKKRRPFALDGSTGLKMTMSAENSTLPAALRGALSRSKTTSLCGLCGSTSKYAVPVSFSYAPRSPNGAPPATTSCAVITIRVTRASARAQTSAASAAAKNRMLLM